MTTADIQTAPTTHFDEVLWKPLIQFFENRYNKRYFLPIEALQNHETFDIRNNCGFLIVSIDCILIETLEQYYAGTDKSMGKNLDPIAEFFSHSKSFQPLNLTRDDAGIFSGMIRASLLHQSKTAQSSVINKRSKTPILSWADPQNKNAGFVINRDKFHAAVKAEFRILIELLKSPEQTDLRSKFKRKLLTLI